MCWHRLLSIFATAILLGAPSGGQAPDAPSLSPVLFPEFPLRELVVHRWTLGDGLTTETLTDVARTADGFLWISTYEGLIRFDGLHFELFDKGRLATQPPLAADGFFDLTLDAEGTLWVAGQNGQVLQVDGRHFRLLETPIQGPVYSLCFDDGGRLWIAGSPPAVLEPGADATATIVSELADLAIEAVACQGETIWFGSNEGFVFRRRPDESSWQRFEVEHPVDALAASGDGSLWIGHRAGLDRLVDGLLSNLAPLDGVTVPRLVEDSRGTLWMATSEGLAKRSSTGKVEWLDSETSGLKEVQALAFDPEENLWAAGRIGGLFRLNQGRIARITPQDGFRPGTVDTLLQLRDGRILVGYDDYLALVDDQRRIVERPLPPTVGQFDILDALEDREGTLWLGGYLGLLRLFDPDRGGGFRFDNQATGFPTSQIRVLFEDSRGTVWVGTDAHGILAFPAGATGNEPLTRLDSSSGLVSNFVFSITEDGQSNLLFGMRGGFNILSPSGDLRTFRSDVDFPGSVVFSLFPDEDNTLWIATDSGLSRFRDDRFSHLDSSHGLPINSLFDLRDDALGWLWMTSTRGIIRAPKERLHQVLDLPPQAPNRRLEFDFFDEEDGMPDRQCTGARHLLETRTGELWIPTHGGIAIVDPMNFPLNQRPPQVVLNRFRVDDVEVDPTTPFTLPPRPARYVFEFAILSLRHPEANRARYTLEGFDPGWREASGARSATYTNLPPGRYTFRVIGANADGVWNQEGARLEFEVPPRLHETVPFRLAVVFTLLMIGAGIYWWRHRELERRHRRAQEVSEQRRRLLTALQERTEEIDRYLYIFSHDFKNPLHTIKNYTGMIRKDLEQDATDRALRDLERVSTAADALNRQIDDLLKVAAVDRSPGSHDFFTFAEIAEAALAHHRTELTQRSVALVRSYPGMDAAEALILQGDRLRLVEAFTEILNNALKFLDSPTPKIEIGAQRERSDALCWIRDNGPGIDPAYHHKIFRPLHQLDARTEGTGIGLALVSRVVERHGGRVWVESDGKNGTTVWLRLPLYEPVKR